MAAIPVDIPHLRRLQQASMIVVRKRIITWMVQDEVANGFLGLYVCTVSAFPEHFRAQRSANFVRASRWWAQHQQYCNEGEEHVISPPISCSKSRLRNQKQLRTKAVVGCGPKRSDWVLWMCPRLLTTFEQFRSAEVKFSSRLLAELAMSILLDPTSPYTAQSRDPKDDALRTSKFTPTWI